METSAWVYLCFKCRFSRTLRFYGQFENTVEGFCCFCQDKTLFSVLVEKAELKKALTPENDLKKRRFQLIDNVYDQKTLEQLGKSADAAENRLRIGGHVQSRRKKRKKERTEDIEYRYVQRGSQRFDVFLDIERKIMPNGLSGIVRDYFGSEDYVIDEAHLLLAYAGAQAQPIHTDADLLFPDAMTPPFYLTLIVNVGTEPCTPDMGPTELYCCESKNFVAPCLQPNQGILFDGLLEHRGGAAVADRVPLVYQVIKRSWYHDINTSRIELKRT